MTVRRNVKVQRTAFGRFVSFIIFWRGLGMKKHRNLGFKTVLALLCACLVIGLTGVAPVWAAETSVCALGDVNEDGVIRSDDARVILRSSARLDVLTARQTLLADMTRDGKIQSADARSVLRIAAKLDTRPTHVPGSSATCTESQICTVCQAVLAEAKGHTPGTAATCTEPQVCTVCGEVIAEALGHSYPTEGSEQERRICTVCGYTDVGEIYAADFSEEDIVTAPDGHTKYVDAELLLTAAENATNADMEAIANEISAEITGRIEITRDYQLKMDREMTYEELSALAESLMDRPAVDQAYLNYVFEMQEDTVSVNDEWNGDSWNENAPGGENWGLEAIHARDAWDYQDEFANIKIGIIDSGFDLSHPELDDSFTWMKDSVVTNHGTHVAGTIAAETNNGIGISGVFPNTQINGIQKAQLYGTCVPTVADFYTYKQKIAELVLRNVKVINISLGYNNYLCITTAASFGNEDAQQTIRNLSEPLGDFLHDLLSLGYDFVIVNSAGNASATDEDVWKKRRDKAWVKTDVTEENPYGWRFYDPARDSRMDAYYGKLDGKWNSPICAIDNHQDVVDRIIVVGAAKNNGTNLWGTHKGYSLCDFSNCGDRVDIVAPGQEIYSTVWRNGDEWHSYNGTYQGTSMAAPHVTGVAAMVWSVNTSLTGAEVKDIICSTAGASVTGRRDLFLPALSGSPKYSWNMLDADAAVEEARARRNGDNHPFTELANGSAITMVVDAETNDPPVDEDGKVISDILVCAYNEEIVGSISELPVATAVTDNAGNLEIVLQPGTYTLVATLDGYLPATIQVTIEENQVNYCEWLKLIPNHTDEYSESVVSGRIINAVSGSGEAGVALTFINKQTGEQYGQVVTSDGSDDTVVGSYSVTLPVGNYTCTASKEGFVSLTFDMVSLAAEETTGQDAAISPVLPEGQYCIVLDWGEYPRDLDSHLIGLTADGSNFHIAFYDMDAYDGDTHIANLDLDDVTSYGPETVTFEPLTGKKCVYFVHNFSGNETVGDTERTLANSNARVRLYKGNELLQTYHVPTDLGSYRYWTVFSIENDVIKNINGFSDTEPELQSDDPIADSGSGGGGGGAF